MNHDTRTMNTTTALQQWVEQSPNRTPSNTLIQTRIGELYCFAWNLKPNAPDERALWLDSNGQQVQQPYTAKP
jgi:hypothetical protein